jgi:hypothetical protein
MSGITRECAGLGESSRLTVVECLRAAVVKECGEVQKSKECVAEEQTNE